jgi:hypothetical protein
MKIDIQDQIVMPLFFALIVALLSGGFMIFIRGNTPRVKRIWICSMLFELGLFYCMAWHDQLAQVFGWKNAWIGASVLMAVGAIYLGRTLLARNARASDSDAEEQDGSGRT